jgi:hypothetical protein
LSGAATYYTHVETLVTGDDWLEFKLSSPNPRRPDGLRRSGVIVAYWVDDNGEHRDQEIGRADLLH